MKSSCVRWPCVNSREHKEVQKEGCLCTTMEREEVDANTSEVELYIWWIVNSATQCLKASTFSMKWEVKSYAESKEAYIVKEWSKF